MFDAIDRFNLGEVSPRFLQVKPGNVYDTMHFRIFLRTAPCGVITTVVIELTKKTIPWKIASKWQVMFITFSIFFAEDIPNLLR